MYCQKCGKEISDEASFCPYCGASTKVTYTSTVGTKPASQSTTTISPKPSETATTSSKFAATSHTSTSKAGGIKNGFGMAGFVLSLVSLFLSLYLVVPSAAVVFSAVGFGLRNRYVEWNKVTTAGLIISIISFVMNLIFLLTLY